MTAIPSTLLTLHGKVYSRVLERRICLIVEPLIQKKHCAFPRGRGTLGQLCTLHKADPYPDTGQHSILYCDLCLCMIQIKMRHS